MFTLLSLKISTRKFASGHEKLQKKRRIEKLVQSHKEALDKFVKSSKKDVNLSEVSIIDQQAQIELKADEPINENNDIEDNNNKNCDNTLTRDCNKNMNKDER